MKKVFFLFMILFLGSFTKAQLTTHTLLTAGYQYQNNSFAEVGGKILLLSNDDFVYRLGGSALLGNVNSKFAVIPKLQGDFLINTQKNVDVLHSYYFLSGVELTPHYVAPKAGFSIFGIVDVSGGYAFPYDKDGIKGKELKGLNFNFTLNLPLVILRDLMK